MFVFVKDAFTWSAFLFGPLWLALGVGLPERMAEEREILAALDHPNIARLYDAGVASNGQPYLALEYVAGRPIDEYVKAGQLPVRARLRLFLLAARAVNTLSG